MLVEKIEELLNLFGLELAMISNLLGIGIVVGSSLIKIPQLYTIYTKSSRGLSLSAFALETIAYFVNYVYGYVHAYPFTTYGENLTLTFQNIIIVGFILKSKFKTILFAIFTLSFIFTPKEFVDITFTLSIPLSLASKLPQIFRSLSPITTFAQFAGCCVRVLTSIKNANGDIPMTVSFAGAAALNGVLILQIVTYSRKQHSFSLPSHHRAVSKEKRLD
ncbi:mannose-P-dolichol utilization defect 1 protein [Wallemia mellicola]|uniref:Mannose-P-dolichol utilization defect 1 protein n=1 Tax=Wallemia mellicola TaxID=1708541 RepID=A0A4T0QTX2_9BASI|nr:mannose-P-dolichol utilization defect 1 protein [Wallemia mellicola]TIB95583.1 mannose-P-dolichol utilization defect 1 protein [Wallemia mellicola]TIB96992.1 mannose-P-dolichol utilization defect 1 protein [Wallemia mellicola]TIC09030.1 mannose-P-dolichol utilization defect 1 protein [Wallemia mellicola]TIC09322.1 mannose-P-dolichol utilization defect 1 protein [Wallemia mellicola]